MGFYILFYKDMKGLHQMIWELFMFTGISNIVAKIHNIKDIEQIRANYNPS